MHFYDLLTEAFPPLLGLSVLGQLGQELFGGRIAGGLYTDLGSHLRSPLVFSREGAYALG
ncbi:hypothetical protein Mro03_58250 [Microbispora rosea subsp. rosea]|nr:hypothetical protein Mro03_58250 [Microbispora rosea subsp. rosea]